MNQEDPGLIGSHEAANRLGVQLETLYAYVSRGLIRSQPASKGTGREKLYVKDDIERLAAKKEVRKDPELAANSALSWGHPSLESELTLIADGRFFYRGEDACLLGRKRNFEEVARFFWSGEWTSNWVFLKEGSISEEKLKSLHTVSAEMDWLERCQLYLPLHEEQCLLPRTDWVGTGEGVIDFLTSMACGDWKRGAVSEKLSAKWGLYPDDQDMIDEALILSLDHELNVSSFTARCIASTNASLHACVIGALSSFRGPKHGANIWRTQAFLREVESEGSVLKASKGRLRRGEVIPGFGHPLYGDEDPRSKRIFQMVQNERPGSKALELYKELRSFGRERLRLLPNVDCGLALLGMALELPEEAPVQIASIGRCAGWIGHAIEQRGFGTLIRPRARYVGKRPRR